MRNLLLAISLLVLPALPHAQVPQTMHYQGYLTTGAGAPLNGATPITFKLYAAAFGGSALWSETHASVNVTNGNYQVILGNSTPFGLPFDAQYWLGVTVSEDAEMAPRQALTMAPYAYRAVTADSVAAGATIQGSQVTGTISNVTISGATIVNPQLADSGGTCDASRAGALRWVPATATFEGCNGSAWLTLEQGSLWGIRVVDPGANRGGYNALAIGADGFPVIAYRDDGTQDLRVAKCADARCTSSTTTVVDSTGNVGEHVSIAMDGANPVIAYHDTGNGKLKVAKCANAACTGASTITTVNDATANVGQYTSITVPPGGSPVISYFDVSGTDLKVAKCSASDCAGASTVNTVESSAGDVGRSSSLAIGAGGFPAIAYHDLTNQRVRFAACNDASCASRVVNTVDPGGSVEFTSLAIGADGVPIIAYRSETTLTVAKCANAQCSGSATITVVDPLPAAYVKIAIGAGGLPVISYQDSTNKLLKVAKCANAACTGTSTIMTVDASSDTGYSTSIAIGGDGRSAVSYFDAVDRKLKLAKCMSPQAPCQ